MLLGTKENILNKILKLGDGECVYFNMFQEGGAVCHYCNGMYLLFEVPLYGGVETYEGTFYKEELGNLIDTALSWT